ncbi:hypothetical protein FRACA_3800004 [Frankia canadensis]|uniref:Transposase IS701-like DDE domain-containing protein n=1 Tax=Frankia canadensis TaxID=1836972 RepID=A0A2I2KW32_9ACTN|nr:hypothetical protein FRACA_3800004 [Frankia canadensis]SOU57146.1 hypothetical protein FRACA_3800004 [Frankia canadensis]
MAATGSLSEMDAVVWDAELEELFGRLADCFRNDQTRVQARAYVAGLLPRTERKNGWTLAEFNQDLGPHKMQRLLSESAWDEDAVADVVRSYVVENLTEAGGVLVIDETGFVKKGTESAGVQRGTAAPLGGSRTVNSACSPHMSPEKGGLWLTGNCAFPTAGPKTGRGARTQAFHPGGDSRRSRCWHWT